MKCVVAMVRERERKRVWKGEVSCNLLLKPLYPLFLLHFLQTRKAAILEIQATKRVNSNDDNNTDNGNDME